MSVDDLRQQLRERGYLTHGIERWFALDPWSSRAFWQELLLVALKAAALIGAFGALPLTAIMLLRNAPLSGYETLALYVGYAAAWVIGAFVVVIAVALTLKVRPALPVDTPGALLAISLGASALLVAIVGLWWWRFDTAPTGPELAAGGALSFLLFLVGSVVISAALLSFSIHEVRRIPLIQQKPRTVPMLAAALALTVALFIPVWLRGDRDARAAMVVTSPSQARLALIAVDGLTWDIFRSRPDLAASLSRARPMQPLPGDSTTERWASVGTGVPTAEHGVRAIEGVRFRGGTHVVQRISHADVVLLRLAPALRLARREPLPPTVRRRDYAWEIVASRGTPSVAVNWWATADSAGGGLHAIGPESIFGPAGGDPLRVDGLASTRFVALLDREHPRFATVYLPALDVILNRLDLDRSTQLTRSLQALEALGRTVSAVRGRGYDVLLVALPGEGQSGAGVFASSFPLEGEGGRRAWDVTPTVLALLGFPPSAEMPGRSLATGPQPERISSYGARNQSAAPAELNEEYYENLRSLGYIR
jgi:hypothetical protein